MNSDLPKASASSIARNGSFDLLRLSLAFGVLFCHSGDLIPTPEVSPYLHFFGGISMQGFFALSGFLVTMSWERAPAIATFLRNRVLRIYPGFVVAGMICLLVVGPLAAPSGKTWLHSLSPLNILFHFAKLSLPNIRIFENSAYPVLNMSLWSIPLEFHCYLLVLLIGALFPTKARGWIWLGVLAVSIFLLVTHVTLPVFRGHNFLFGGMDRRPDLLCAFAIGAVYFHYMNAHTKLRRAFPAIFVISIAYFANIESLHIVGSIFLATSILQIGLSSRIGKWIPKPPVDISYGVYLYAWPIQQLLLHYFPDIKLIPHLAVCCVLSIIMGWLSWEFIESKFMGFKAK